MPKFIVDLWMDGYETEEEMNEACAQFIYDRLNMTASSVQIEGFEESDAYKLAQLVASKADIWGCSHEVGILANDILNSTEE